MFKKITLFCVIFFSMQVQSVVKELDETMVLKLIANRFVKCSEAMLNYPDLVSLFLIEKPNRIFIALVMSPSVESYVPCYSIDSEDDVKALIAMVRLSQSLLGISSYVCVCYVDLSEEDGAKEALLEKLQKPSDKGKGEDA